MQGVGELDELCGMQGSLGRCVVPPLDVTSMNLDGEKKICSSPIAGTRGNRDLPGGRDGRKSTSDGLK